MKHQLVHIIIGALLLLSMPWQAHAQEKLLYRYKNAQGVVVMTYGIPPQFVSKGYELVKPNGTVVKVVPPEPTNEEKAQLAAEEAEELRLEEWDKRLLRRYSTPRDIEAAKKRKLVTIKSSIAILQSNISGLNNEIDKQQAKAADSERQGKQVPPALLKVIFDLQEELKTIEAQLITRKQDIVDEGLKFDQDIARFRIIKQDVSSPNGSPGQNAYCNTAIANGREWIDSMREAARRNLRSGQISKIDYQQSLPEIRRIERLLTLSQCTSANDENKAFFQCLQDKWTPITDCIIEHKPAQ